MSTEEVPTTGGKAQLDYALQSAFLYTNVVCDSIALTALLAVVVWHNTDRQNRSAWPIAIKICALMMFGSAGSFFSSDTYQLAMGVQYASLYSSRWYIRLADLLGSLFCYTTHWFFSSHYL